ncbi:MAG TPA: hypothetical protein VKQ32_27450 [Polyangia bacterium]|nr:hypothetical protein [Polyangia bacterium]
MNSHSRSRAVASAALVLALSGGLAAGCGGSSSGGPEDAFIGRWFQQSPNPADPTATGFNLTCTDPAWTSLTQPIQFWTELQFEHGTLTTLAETGPGCPGINYTIKGKAATVPHPDPYTGMDPGCVIQFTNTDASGNSFPAFLVITPGDAANWSFMLLDTKSSGGAPQGRLAGSATGHIITVDATNTVIMSNPDCTYAGMDTYYRLTQP